MTSPRVLLIIPCYNEAGAISPLLQEIGEVGAGDAVIVIDDGSEDGTASRAAAHAPVIRLVRNLGIGGAVQTGIKYAKNEGYDFCVQVDGDGQHPPGEIARLLEHQRQSQESIVVGSRYIANSAFRSTWARRMGGGMIARALNWLFPGARITDPTSGMRLMDRRAIEFFAEHYPHDFPEPISLAWGLRAGLAVGEVAVSMRAREHGASSIGRTRALAYMFRVLGYILIARFCASPGKLR